DRDRQRRQQRYPRVVERVDLADEEVAVAGREGDSRQPGADVAGRVADRAPFQVGLDRHLALARAARDLGWRHHLAQLGHLAQPHVAADRGRAARARAHRPEGIGMSASLVRSLRMSSLAMTTMGMPTWPSTWNCVTAAPVVPAIAVRRALATWLAVTPRSAIRLRSMIACTSGWATSASL